MRNRQAPGAPLGHSLQSKALLFLFSPCRAGAEAETRCNSHRCAADRGAKGKGMPALLGRCGRAHYWSRVLPDLEPWCEKMLPKSNTNNDAGRPLSSAYHELVSVLTALHILTHGEDTFLISHPPKRKRLLTASYFWQESIFPQGSLKFSSLQ